MKLMLTIATLAFTGAAGIAYAQTIEPYDPSTVDELGTPVREVYIAQGPAGPEYIDETDLRVLKREARKACGDRPDSMLDLVAWKMYRQCVFVEIEDRGGDPYYPYERYDR